MVIQEAWIGGVSTRRVDELFQAMGLSGISKSQVSKLCKDVDERVNAFLDRPIEGEWSYLWLDATYLKVRDGGRIISVAATTNKGPAYLILVPPVILVEGAELNARVLAGSH